MPLSDSRIRRAFRKELDRLWLLGRSHVIGWRLMDGHVALLLLPNSRLTEFARFPRGIVDGDSRLLSEHMFDALARRHRLDVMIIEKPSFPSPSGVQLADIEDVLRRYSLWFTPQRGVALLDIVGFSRAGPLEQAAQLHALAYSIAIAQRRCRGRGFDIRLARSTTGDGFYLWNLREGVGADHDLLALVLVALADNRLTALERHAVPRLRCAICLGSHFSYFLPERDGEGEHAFIVGDATIAAARLVAAARARQILVGANLVRRGDGARSFIAALQRRADRLAGVELLDGRLEGLRVRLTARGEAAPLVHTDKHGEEHAAFNLRVDLLREAGLRASLGIASRALADDQSATVNPPST
jgi:class 3 adenylate cyclase